MQSTGTASTRSLILRCALGLFATLALARIPWSFVAETARQDARENVRHQAGHAAEATAAFARDRLRTARGLHLLAKVVAQRWVASGEARVPEYALSEIKAIAGRSDLFGEGAGISIVAPDGAVIWNSVNSRADLTIIDRDYFKAIVEGRLSRVLSPQPHGVVTNREIVAYAEAIRAPDGALIAVTVVTFPPDVLLPDAYPHNAARSAHPSPRDAPPFRLALRWRDGQAVARGGGTGAERPAIAAARAEAFATGAGVADVSADKIVALHRVRGFDLAAEVEADAGPALAAAARQSLTDEMTGAAVLVLLFVAIAVSLVLRSRGATLRAVGDRLDAMRLVTDNIDELVLLFELDKLGRRRFIFVSPSTQRLLGVPPEALLADEARLVLHPEDRAAMADRMAALHRGEAVPEQDFRVLDAGGAIRWFSVSTRRISDAEGEPGARRFIASWRDITARRDAEQAIATRDSRLDSLAANIVGGLYDGDYPSGGDGGPGRLKLRYMSPGVALLTGYTPDQLARPGSFEHMTSSATVERRAEFLREVLEFGQAEWEFELTRADGRVIHVRDRARRISGDRQQGNIIGFSVDITNEVQFREGLVAAGRLALLGELSASIAHEMNQPLAVIGMRAAMLESASDASPWPQERVAAAGAVISKMVDRLTRVALGVRDFARDKADAPEPFDPAMACAAAMTIVEPHLKTRPATFRTATPPTPLAALGHIGSFEQVLINLFTNAIDAYDHARPDAERLIEVTITGAGGNVAVTVTDHAGGILDEALPKLFDAFFTTKPAGKGTGLGLAICHRIMRDMGGSITAANTADGAAFTLTVPMAT